MVETVVSARPLPGTQLVVGNSSRSVVTTWSLHKWSTALVKAAMLPGHGVQPGSSIIEYYQSYIGVYFDLPTERLHIIFIPPPKWLVPAGNHPRLTGSLNFCLLKSSFFLAASLPQCLVLVGIIGFTRACSRPALYAKCPEITLLWAYANKVEYFADFSDALLNVTLF